MNPEVIPRTQVANGQDSSLYIVELEAQVSWKTNVSWCARLKTTKNHAVRDIGPCAPTYLAGFLPVPVSPGMAPRNLCKVEDDGRLRELIDAARRPCVELHGFWFNLEGLYRVIDLTQPLGQQLLADPS